jgi:hypothetical protein
MQHYYLLNADTTWGLYTPAARAALAASSEIPDEDVIFFTAKGPLAEQDCSGVVYLMFW